MTVSVPILISCAAPYGQGGLGREFAELVAGLRTAGEPVRYFATGIPDGDPDGEAIAVRWLPWVFRYTPVRFSPGWKSFLGCRAFDRAVARRLKPAQAFFGFDGSSLDSFRSARRLGYGELNLESAMSHVDNVRRQLARAHAAHPIEPAGLIGSMVRRVRAEYAAADVVWVTSEYSRGTHLDAGIPPAKLRKRTLRPSERFSPPAGGRPDDGVFRVVFVGSLCLRKGTPVLINAFRRFQGRAELALVGGSGTRGMRRYLEEAVSRDPRVRIVPGDPLPHFHRADVCVHPAYEDGFGYAPMEALACGVPVVVTDQTGMKEYVREGENGYVVPAGDADAILERLEHLRRHPLHPAALPAGGPG